MATTGFDLSELPGVVVPSASLTPGRNHHFSRDYDQPDGKSRSTGAG